MTNNENEIEDQTKEEDFEEWKDDDTCECCGFPFDQCSCDCERDDDDSQDLDYKPDDDEYSYSYSDYEF